VKVASADAIAGWVSELPIWQQDLVCRVAQSVELDEEEIGAALGVVGKFFKIPVDGVNPPMLTFSPSLIAPHHLDESELLVTLGPLSGVGMLVPDGQIPISPAGMTIIYGQNAAGKSSYVRALKALCRTVDTRSRIWGNVYTESNSPPRARLTLLRSGAAQEVDTPLTGDEVHQLRGVSVFDSASAELYVDQKGTFRYIPSELLVLTRLGALQDELRRRLDEQRVDLENRAPDLDSIPEDTSAGQVVRSIEGKDSDPDLASVSPLIDVDQARRVELRAAVAAAEASTAKADAIAAKGDASDATLMADEIVRLSGVVGSEQTATLRRLATEEKTAQTAVALASQQFSDSPVPGIGSDSWRVLWAAARSFAEGQRATFPPLASEACPLCLQVVSDPAADRLAHFEAHVTSEVQEVATRATASLQQALEARDPVQVDSMHNPFLDRLRGHDSELAEAIASYLSQLREELVAAWTNPFEATAEDDGPAAILARLREWGMQRANHAEQLLAAQDEEGSVTLRRELVELDARQELIERTPEFTSWRANLIVLARIEAAKRALATNKITIKQGALAEEIVGDVLKKSLNEELGRLRCQHLPISADLHGAKVNTSVELKLVANQPAALKDIVSEGERRAIALSFYFAELSVRDDRCGIVLDDPVSSLDDERRQYIADRLVAEAGRRQVVVFTHDLPFLADLQSRAKVSEVDVSTCGVWRFGDEVGRVDSDIPFKALPLSKRIGKLKDRVARWDSQSPPADQDEAWRRVTQFYRDLRTSWERAVEERLFKGVVQRHQRGVQTQQLRKVEITKDLLDKIEAGMTKTSEYLHDEASAASLGMPTRADLEADLDLLIAFEKEVKAP
jgi:recombinational DNA repair ATPase RecF